MPFGLREQSDDPAELAGFPTALARPSGDVLPETVDLELRDGARQAESVDVGAVAGVVNHRHDGNVVAVVVTSAAPELVLGGSILKVQVRITGLCKIILVLPSSRSLMAKQLTGIDHELFLNGQK